jgi:hypothetical protein
MDALFELAGGAAREAAERAAGYLFERPPASFLNRGRFYYAVDTGQLFVNPAGPAWALCNLDCSLLTSGRIAPALLGGPAPDSQALLYPDGWRLPAPTAGGAGAGSAVITPGGRLSLINGQPIYPVDATGPTVYYIPYLHNVLTLWNGTAWSAATYSQQSFTPTLTTTYTITGATTTLSSAVISVSSTTNVAIGMPLSGTNIPANATVAAFSPNVSITMNVVASGSGSGITLTLYSPCLDVFAYLSAGAVAIETLPWTSPTARATGISLQDGRYCKATDKTRLYLGTIQATGFNITGNVVQFSDTYAARMIWNQYNQVPRGLRVADATQTWTTVVSWRQARAQWANRVDVCAGNVGAHVNLNLNVKINASNTGAAGFIGIGENSVTAPHPSCFGRESGYQVSLATSAHLDSVPPNPGYNYYAWLEAAYNGVTITISGDTTALAPTDPTVAGLSGFIMG